MADHGKDKAMAALDLMLELLAAQPWPVRSRLMVHRSGSRLILQPGGMQAVARELDDGQIEVLYEHALHETTRERVPPEVAVRLLLAIMEREQLCRVEGPGAGL